MEKHGKVKNYLIAAISIALLSVIICLSNLTDSYSAMKIIKEDFSFELRDVSDVVYSENTVIGLDPVIEKNKVKKNYLVAIALYLPFTCGYFFLKRVLK